MQNVLRNAFLKPKMNALNLQTNMSRMPTDATPVEIYWHVCAYTQEIFVRFEKRR